MCEQVRIEASPEKLREYVELLAKKERREQELIARGWSRQQLDDLNNEASKD